MTPFSNPFMFIPHKGKQTMNDRGYLPVAIVERFATNADGSLELLTGSTWPQSISLRPRPSQRWAASARHKPSATHTKV